MLGTKIKLVLNNVASNFFAVVNEGGFPARPKKILGPKKTVGSGPGRGELYSQNPPKEYSNVISDQYIS
jgi:hypothetical protein